MTLPWKELNSMLFILLFNDTVFDNSTLYGAVVCRVLWDKIMFLTPMTLK